MRYKEVLAKRRYSRDLVIPALIKSGFKDLAEKLYNCADYFKYALCNDCYTAHYDGFDSCKQRFCPICSKKRSMLYFAKFTPVLRNLIKAGYYVVGLNFTIVDCEDLQKTIKVLNTAFRYMQSGSKELRKEFNKRFIGGFRCTETKVGVFSKLWHSHLHCLAIKKEKSYDIDFLAEAWNRAVKLAGGKESETVPGLYGMCSVFTIKDKHNLNSPTEKSIEIGVLETMKYITKFNFEMDIDKLPELIKSLKGVRMVNTWGLLRKINTNVEKDMNKSYTEVMKLCCSNCGSYNFSEFYSKRAYRDIAEFDINNAIVEFESNIKSGLCVLTNGLEIGKMYGGVMFTEEHAKFYGKEFVVRFEKGKYLSYIKDDIHLKKDYQVFVNKNNPVTHKNVGMKAITMTEHAKAPGMRNIEFADSMLVHIVTPKLTPLSTQNLTPKQR